MFKKFSNHTYPITKYCFFLGLIYPPARKMIDSGLPITLASDYNPGSSPSGNIELFYPLLALN